MFNLSWTDFQNSEPYKVTLNTAILGKSLLRSSHLSEQVRRNKKIKLNYLILFKIVEGDCI